MLTWDEYCTRVWRIRHGVIRVVAVALLVVLASGADAGQSKKGGPDITGISLSKSSFSYACFQ